MTITAANCPSPADALGRTLMTDHRAEGHALTGEP